MKSVKVLSLIVGAASAEIRFPAAVTSGPTTATFEFNARLLNPRDLGFPAKGLPGFPNEIDPLAWLVAEWNSSNARRDAALARIREWTTRTIAEVRASGKTRAVLDLEIFVPAGTFDYFGLRRRFNETALARAQSGVLNFILSLWRQLAPEIEVGIYNLPTTEYLVVRSSEPYTGGSHRERRKAWFETYLVDAQGPLSLVGALYPSVYLARETTPEDARGFIRETIAMCRIVRPGVAVRPVLGLIIGDYVGGRVPPLVPREVTLAMLDECRILGAHPAIWGYCPRGTPEENARTKQVQEFFDRLVSSSDAEPTPE